MDAVSRRGSVCLQSLVLLLLLGFHAAALADPIVEDATLFGGDILIKGKGFDRANDQVTVNGTSVKVVDGSATFLQASVPQGGAIGRITVTDSAGHQGISAKEYAFTSTLITGFNPTSGSVGSSIFITGKNFDPVAANNVVSFGGAETKATFATDTALLVALPKGAATGPVAWKNNRINAVATSSGVFTVVDKPVVTGITPDHGPTGINVDIKGGPFEKGKESYRVFFGGSFEGKVEDAKPTYLRVRVPEKASSGSVTVRSADGLDLAGSAVFTVTGPPLSFEPTSGTRGATVIVSGARFDEGEATVTFNGVVADSTYRDDHKIVVTVPDTAQSGYITVTTPDGSYVTGDQFKVIPSKRAIHLYGGGTVNFFSDSNDGTATEPQPLVGLLAAHSVPMPALFSPLSMNEDGELLFTGELSYRGVAADKAIVGSSSTGLDLKGLAAASSVGLFVNAYYSLFKGDSFTFGPNGMIGYEFLTGDRFKHDAQNSNGVYIRVQDQTDPLFFGQVGYGNTHYLKPNRLLFDLSVPLMTSLLQTENPTSFYDKNFTDFYFFVGANVGIDHRKDDSFIFGVKGVISAARLVKLFDPNSILVDKTQNAAAPKPAAAPSAP